jgi:crotonobetainyl-CoA:carnitine CoA-transferase CaiB-like acyl-CoA transferase
VLEGIRIVELATYVAAPGAAGILSDWGAEVIKIESPAGDPWRKFFDSLGTVAADNPVFELDNRGKRGIVLDISKPDGLEAVQKLLATADVFLTNIRPGALKRAHLDWETLTAANPRLVYCSLTGYGLQGVDVDRAGFDVAAFWSRAGVGSITAPKGEDPFPSRTAMGDHVTSISTCAAILAAVVERNTTGKGRLVETSLLRTGVYSIGTDMAIQLKMGRLASTKPRPEATNPLANFFKTSDGRWICLIPRQGGLDTPQILSAAGVPELIDDPRFAKARDRRTNGPALVAALDAAFGSMSFDQLAERLDKEDIAWAPYQTPREVAEDEQVAAAGCFVEMTASDGTAFRSPASPARFPGYDDTPRSTAPKLGEHTRSVLLELGYSEDDIKTRFGVA